MNPLLYRHLYRSARKGRFFLLLMLYLIILGLLTAGLMGLNTYDYSYYIQHEGLSMVDIYSQGRSLYWYATVILFLAANLLVPINALGSISGERENRTLDLLRTTTLSPRDIVLGQMSAATLNGLLYILAPIPLLMGSYWLGGVSTPELLLTFLFLIMSTLSGICWAFFFSTYIKKTIVAVFLFYGLTLAMLPLIGLFAAGSGALSNVWHHSNPLPVLHPWIEGVITNNWVFLAGLHPIPAAAITEYHGLEYGTWVLLELSGSRAPLHTIRLPAPWITYTLFTSLLNVWLVKLCINRLRRPER